MTPQAGWYDDPHDETLLRYWDGVEWTRHTAPRRKAGLDRVREDAVDGTTQGRTGPAGAAGQPGGQGWGAARDDGWNGAAPWGRQEPVDTRRVTPDGQPLAGWWHRAGAAVIDLLLVGLVNAIVLVPLVAPTLTDRVEEYVREVGQAVEAGAVTAPPVPDGLDADLTRSSIALVTFGVLYSGFMVTRWGATVGKLLTGLRVRLRDEPGPPPARESFLRALFYHLIPQFPLIGMIAGLLNVLWPAWDPCRQALHDKVARTNVVRRR